MTEEMEILVSIQSWEEYGLVRIGLQLTAVPAREPVEVSHEETRELLKLEEACTR
jgi:hypothetical protein